MAEDFGCTFLIEYAAKITKEVEMIDLDLLKVTLNEFPTILSEISQLIKA